MSSVDWRALEKWKSGKAEKRKRAVRAAVD
jgi:hypothetical protein